VVIYIEWAVLIVFLMVLDWLLHYRIWSRITLVVLYIAWATRNTLLTVSLNPGHESGALKFSVLQWLGPLLIWQFWTAILINARKKRRASPPSQSS
jgi:hypothetical protein